MQFSEQWLRQLVNPPHDSEALEHLLTMAGLEVEECHPVAPPFDGVVVGEVVAISPHPDADKLRVCRVDDGSGESLQVVCGAPNAERGRKFPFARVGTTLPGGFKIKKARLRGVESAGMLCSARELQLSGDPEGLLQLSDDAPLGADVREVLALDDLVYLIKLTPNRADCLSLLGVAREVAALTGAALHAPAVDPVAPAIDDRRDIVLDDSEACPRYCGRVIRGVDATAPTPEWMRVRLERCGVRPISALVDVTNYVMLELGQPLHAFDNDRLEGVIHVRYPRGRESLALLNEQTVDVADNSLLVADERQALALAGIMGGEEASVTLDTREVFLESAFFAPDAIAGRAREYGFSSDASHRFERGVDFALAPHAMERCTALILDICGGRAGPVVEAVDSARLPRRDEVCLRTDRARRVLGIDLDDEAMADLLEGIHLQVGRGEGVLTVVPPSFRFDIEIEEDLIEEVVRLHGYDAITPKVPSGPLEMLPLPEAGRTHWSVRRFLAARDFQEVINYAFVDERWERELCGNNTPVKLANPIASQMSVMRSSMIPGLVATLATNRNRQHQRVRLFELGRCFEPDGSEDVVAGYRQPLRLAALAAGPALAEQWGVSSREVDFFDLKGDLGALLAPLQAEFTTTQHPALHPGRAAAISQQGCQIGVIGELHPGWVEQYGLGSAPVLFELELEAVLSASVPEYKEVSRYPVVSRDLALIVDEKVAVADLVARFQASAAAIVRSVELFDLYHGKGIDPGKKSLAFRILMQDTHRTLEEAEVEAAVAGIVREAEASFGAKLRG